MTTREGEGKAPDEETRERSAEQRDITAPTPRDVREKADADPEAAERIQPPSEDA